MKLCLNSIVRNESARIERMLSSVVPYISCWAIRDTGSTDGTQDIILTYFKHRRETDGLNPVGCLFEGEFTDFSSARNAALDNAESLPLEYDYILLVDADMELKVDHTGWRIGDIIAADPNPPNAYRLIQRDNTISYRNTRLVKRGCGARYVGVTHEYLSVPGETASLDGAWFVDHQDGSNRKDKFIRDLKLLDADLLRDPDNPRTHFYRAQTLKDMGRFEEAAEGYMKRAELGGWDEEVMYAWLQASRCVRQFG
jgi:glycosyltransferase involved in cell wall biosynthesis